MFIRIMPFCIYYCFRVLSLMGNLVSNLFTFYGSYWRIGAKGDFLFLPFHGSSYMWSHVIASLKYFLALGKH